MIFITFKNSSLFNGSFFTTSKFFFMFSRDFIPHIVDMIHLGGIDLTNCRCLATGSEIFYMASILISRTPPSRIGFETIMFI